MSDPALFLNPPEKYAVRVIAHALHKKIDLFLESYHDFGFGGAVVNVPFDTGKEDDPVGFTSNPENLKKFQTVLDKLKEHGFPYWIYDESGYPSGQGGGLTLSMIMSAVLFKEKITVRCIVGILITFAALLIINLL